MNIGDRVRLTLSKTNEELEGHILSFKEMKGFARQYVYQQVFIAVTEKDNPVSTPIWLVRPYKVIKKVSEKMKH